MSAAYTLPGEVIEVREPLAALRAADIREGEIDPLPIEIAPGYYALVSQRGKLLFIAAVGEGESGQVEVVGPLFAVPVSVLETASVGISYLVVKGIERETRPPD